MKKLTAEDLFALQYGETVYRFRGLSVQSFQYVGRMPSSPDSYLIFSEGEMLTHLYIHKDGTFRDEWYGGEFNSNIVDLIEIGRLEKRLEELKSRLI